MIDVTGGNAVYYYHFDGLGSVAALSNNNGEIVERYEYDVFGRPDRVSDVNNPYFFTGRRYDDETGLYYYRARYYDPYIGRFLQTDPIRYEDGSNLYTYCYNNPLYWIDPWGLKAGDKYKTQDEAAMAAMDDIHDKSAKEGVEYAGWVYKRWRGGYSYSEPRRGTPYSSNPGRYRLLRLERGIHHTHVEGPPATNPEEFSERDKEVADKDGIDMYLDTPKGYQKKYDPDKPEGEKESILKSPKDKKGSES